MTPALSLKQAQDNLLALCEPLTVETIPVFDGLGRYLTAPLVARRTQPPTDLSAMDGYAMDSSRPAGPWTVVGESAAGHPFERAVSPGDAIRISTGAALPTGATTILLQEDTRRDGDQLLLDGETPAAGRHIRRAGFDFSDGETLADAGTLLTPQLLALAISAGHATLPLPRKPRVAIIDSGDELASDPQHCAPHQIPASNGPMLRAMFAQFPCEVSMIGPIKDNLDHLVSALEQAASADLIVTTGGASVGDHDLIRPALERWGADLAFWRVAIKPGKPIMVATKTTDKRRELILGLPGNPVSCHVTAYFFALPLIRAMLGATQCLPRPISAKCTSAIPAGGKRMEFLRARWDGATVTPLSEQDSSALRALSRANALIERPVNGDPVPAGSPVSIYLLENGGNA